VDIANFLDAIERLAPSALAEEWDNVGLIVGRRTHVVRRVVVALDLRGALLEEALREAVDTVLVHHPPIFPALTDVSDSSAAGELVLTAAEHAIAVVAAHTNLDSARGGLNDQMAELLGVREAVPLVPAAADPAAGLGRVGTCTAQRLGDLVDHVAATVPGPVTWTGDRDARITRVACCTGSGASFIDDARDADADVYVTSDLKYHDADRAPRLALIAVPHGRIEAMMIARWCAQLAEALASEGVVVTTAATDTDPWQPARPATL
jgi:dinuclear metal center YbgI/SA1388 family protein